MNDYQIFSGSSCDLPASLIERHQIRLVPFYVTFDQENYYKENIDITNEAFYQKLGESGIFPKTSLPSVQDYINLFTPVLKEGRDCLCLCLTQKFSGSFQSAVNAKLILNEKYPDCRIEVVDTIQATAGQGLTVLQAAYMKEAGYSMDEVISRLNEIKFTSRIMFTVDTLEYLAKGGRIGKVTSLAGTMLNLKPMIQLKDAELIPYSKVRGRKKALESIIPMLTEYFEQTGESFDDYDFAMANATTPDDIRTIQIRLEELTGRKLAYPIFQIGVTIGTYTGPGAVGVRRIKKALL